MRIKVINEKDKVYELKELGFTIDEHKFFEKVVYSHRIIPRTALIEIESKHNEITVIYDDYSKFDTSKLAHKEYRGGFSKQIADAYSRGILKEIIYDEDIMKYIREPKDMYFDIIDVYKNIENLVDAEDICKGVYIIAEFILNLAQHNYRKHNKYIIIENGYGVETQVNNENVITLGHKELNLQRLGKIYSRVLNRGYSTVIINTGIHSGYINKSEKLKIEQKAKSKGLNTKYRNN